MDSSPLRHCKRLKGLKRTVAEDGIDLTNHLRMVTCIDELC
jgi:hypothetical protein